MTELWLQIIGIGEDGLAGLSPDTRAALGAAEVIVGGARHHALASDEALAAAAARGEIGWAGAGAPDASPARPAVERIRWPSPFNALVERIAGFEGRRTVVLVTGAPLWFSAGARLAEAFPDAVIHPQLSAFQLAAARMGWRFETCTPLTVHGRDAVAIRPHVQPGARLLILASGPETAAEIGALLVEDGYGASPLRALSHVNGPKEAWTEAPAHAWGEGRLPPHPGLTTLAVACVAGPEARLAPAVPGLADDLFAHDGVMTKREVRAMTLARLAPLPGGMLWDVGCGCGSVAVEWMRAARGARAVGIEPRADRRALAAANARRLGTPGLEIREGTAPEALAGLPAPDAVFLGGGLSEAAVDAARAALRPRGRLVANAVTLESEALLLALHGRLGGDLTRISISRAAPVGTRSGWRPSMDVTQWSLET